jgi:hypothetical protein
VKTEADVKLAKAIDAAVETYLKERCGLTSPERDKLVEAMAGISSAMICKFAMVNAAIGVPLDLAQVMAATGLAVVYPSGKEHANATTH